MLPLQESIKASKDWFMACAPHASGLAAKMAEACGQAATPYDKALHVIYLANDVLLKGCGSFSSAHLAANCLSMCSICNNLVTMFLVF